MNDCDIRQLLHEHLRILHAGEPDTLVMDEFGLLLGDARADLVAINGAFHGYEIKSNRDTLERLPHQRTAYGLCFDTVTLVVGSKHIKSARPAVPRWWGIIEAVESPQGPALIVRRLPKKNPTVNAESVAQLLWRDELSDVLASFGVDPGKKTRQELWQALAALMPIQELCSCVRIKLKARGDWRSAGSPFRRADLRQSAASAQRSQKNRRWLLSQKSPDPLR